MTYNHHLEYESAFICQLIVTRNHNHKMSWRSLIFKSVTNLLIQHHKHLKLHCQSLYCMHRAEMLYKFMLIYSIR